MRPISYTPYRVVYKSLILAIVRGYKDIALALLSTGADVHTKDSTGWTHLHWACTKGLKEVYSMSAHRRRESSE